MIQFHCFKCDKEANLPITKTFEVVFYKSGAGNEPVREWLLGLDKDDKKIIGTDIKLIELSGELKPPQVKKIDTQNKLWEARSHLASDKIARVLFTLRGKKMILLHGFIKKSQKISQQDKQVALMRLKKLGGSDEK